MPVTAADLVYYGAASIAEDDSSTQGGAIDTTVRYVFDSATLPNTLNDTIEMLSSNVGDTSQTVLVTGRNAGGSIITENFSLNGTTVVNGVTTFQRILKITVSATHSGTVTVRKESDNSLIVDIESGVLEVRKPFYNTSSDEIGGSSREFYEKIFIKNNHLSLFLLGAVISEQADPEVVIDFNLENSVNGSEDIASRLNTSPGDVTGSFDSSPKSIPGSDLESGDAVGIWCRLTLSAGHDPILSSFTMRIAGNSI